MPVSPSVDVQIDPATSRIVHRYALPPLLRYGDGALWVDSYDANAAWKIDLP